MAEQDGPTSDRTDPPPSEHKTIDFGEQRGWQTLPAPATHDEPPQFGLDPLQPAAQDSGGAETQGEK